VLRKRSLLHRPHLLKQVSLLIRLAGHIRRLLVRLLLYCADVAAVEVAEAVLRLRHLSLLVAALRAAVPDATQLELSYPYQKSAPELLL